MSRWKNAAPRREHRERSQPHARAKLGLLEKKKDYKQRAVAYHRKQDRLQALRLRAAFRNPDEFSHKMIKSQTTGGRHRDSASTEQLTADELALMKSQDLAYMHTKQQTEKKKIEKLRSHLHFLDAPKQNKHILFLDDEKKMKDFSAAEHFDTVPELADRAYNRTRRKTLKEGKVLGATDKKSVKKLRKKRDASYAELGARMERVQKISRTTDHMQLQRNLAGKGKRMKVKDAEDGQPAVFKWARQRKR